LTAGEQVALVTDAGTPGVSDPGIELINACWDHDVTVDPVPGAAAPIAAAVASGFALEPLTVLGFAPARAKDRNDWLTDVQDIHGTVTFFEAPHRIHATLAALVERCGDRPILVAREMTKRHQEFVRAESPAALGHMPDAKGEFTVVLGPRAPERIQAPTVSDEVIFDEFCRMPSVAPGGRRAIVVNLGKKYGRSPKDVYAIVERLKKLGA
jgi:16S rRNA (cytidine1402-2'-O)-methyltransferase